MKLDILLIALFITSIMSCKPRESNTSDTEVVKTENVEIVALTSDSLMVDDLVRKFEFYKPNNAGINASLVFVLHGSRGSIADARRYTGYEFEKAALVRGGHIIVYPQGYENHWNDCRGTASYKANVEDVDDITFYDEMIRYFIENHQIDRESVFATGISNGGHMCYKLAFEMPDQFSGIAPIVANIPQMENNDCSLKNVAISVMIMNGTADPINPDKGGWVVLGQDSSRGAVISTMANIDYWKDLNNCESDPVTVEYDNIVLADSSNVIHYKYSCSMTNKKVELVKIVNGGHTVPINDDVDLPDNIKKFVGNKNRDVNGPMIIMDFFESLN